MKNVKFFEIIEGPIITEKSMALKDQANKYTFKVKKSANKIEIKNAIESIYKVEVLSVATINVLPKTKRVGRHVGKTSAYKKAICKLAAGQSIDAFEL